MEVVVQGVAFTQEFRGEQDPLIIETSPQMFGISHGDGRFDDDPCIRIDLTDGPDRGLDARRVEIVLLRIIIGRRRHNGEIGIRISLMGIQRRREIQGFVARLLRVEESCDLLIDDGALPIVQHLDLFRDDIQGMHAIVLRQQQCHRQSDISRTSNCDLHQSVLSSFLMSSINGGCNRRPKHASAKKL